jgi:uncharacterized protein with HEPN domain
MPRALDDALVDILEAIDRTEAYAAGRSFGDLQSNPMLNDALERCIERVSEAVSQHIPDEIKGRYPGVPWPQIRAIGNRLRHGYFGVDPRIIWDTATVDLPALRATIVDIQQRHVSGLASAAPRPTGAGTGQDGEE